MIVQAAVKLDIKGLDSFSIVPVHRHGDIGRILNAFGFKPGKGYKILEQGFLDEHGNFYNRVSAMKEAKRCKQYLIGEEKEELFSENLY